MTQQVYLTDRWVELEIHSDGSWSAYEDGIDITDTLTEWEWDECANEVTTAIFEPTDYREDR